MVYRHGGQERQLVTCVWRQAQNRWPKVATLLLANGRVLRTCCHRSLRDLLPTRCLAQYYDRLSSIFVQRQARGPTLIRQYKQHSSDFASWDQKAHAKHWLVFPENMGANLAIDEVSLSNGELWTFLTNKDGKGRKGTLVAAIRGTRTADIEQVLFKIPPELRLSVKEVSMDMAKNIESAIRAVFTQAKIVTDRFHVVQLIQRSLQDVRISLWRGELDRESKLIEQARASGITYRPGRTGKRGYPEATAGAMPFCPDEV
jgi:hypothetical protein